MLTDADKNKIGRFINGIWLYEYTDAKNILKQVKLVIEEGSITILSGVNNVFNSGEKISTSAHWFNDYLIFTATKYYVRYADKNVMTFGEMGICFRGTAF